MVSFIQAELLHEDPTLLIESHYSLRTNTNFRGKHLNFEDLKDRKNENIIFELNVPNNMYNFMIESTSFYKLRKILFSTIQNYSEHHKQRSTAP